MKSTFSFLTLLLCSSQSFAMSLKCIADYHVLAYYEHSGKAIERKQESFELEYEPGKQLFKAVSLPGRELRVLSGLVYDSAQSGGTGTFIEGVWLTITNPSNNEAVDTIAPIESHLSGAFTSLRAQPGILPNEIGRDYFWSVTCRW